MKTQVTHSRFGTGNIVSMDDKNVKVDFNGTVKSLIIQFAGLTLEDGTTLISKSIIMGNANAEMPKRESKKINPANFMNKAEYSRSKWSKMDKYEFEEEMRKLQNENLPSSMR